MNVYETSDVWAPDQTYINSKQDIMYLAWNIGRDRLREKSLWLIEGIDDYPAVELETLLPEDYTSTEFIDDVIRYGHVRTLFPSLSIGQLQDAFIAELERLRQQRDDGFI